MQKPWAQMVFLSQPGNWLQRFDRIDTALADPIAVAGGDEDASLLAERYAAILSATLLVESTLLRAFTLDADTIVAPARASGSALGVGYAIAALVVDA